MATSGFLETGGGRIYFEVQVLIAKETYDRLVGVATVSPLGSVRLKGKGEAVHVYDLRSLEKGEGS